MKEESLFPSVTIVTLTYMNFDLIEQTITSVLTQNYANIKYVIIDDGSENFPLTEIQKIIEKKNINKISVLIEKSSINKGTVAEFNYALSKCKTEFFFPLSAGDSFIDSNTIKDIVDEMERRKTNFLICSRIRISKNNQYIEKIPSKREIKYFERRYKTLKQQYYHFLQGEFRNIGSGSATYYRTSFLNSINGFDQRYYLWEDGPFYFETASLGNILSVNYNICSINYLDGGISSKSSLSKSKIILQEDQNTFFKNSFEICKHKKIPLHVKRGVFALYYSSIHKSFKSKILIHLLFIDVYIKKWFYRFFSKHSR